MKANLNILVDIGSEFIECEGGTENCISVSISDEIQNSLKWNIKNEVLKQISETQINAIRNEITEYVLNNIKSFILGKFDSEFNDIKFKDRGVMLDAKTYIVNKLKSEIDSYDSAKKVKTIAEEYSKSIKERYDVVFASTFLDKIMKCGLLKDDRIADLLKIDNKNGDPS